MNARDHVDRTLVNGTEHGGKTIGIGDVLRLAIAGDGTHVGEVGAGTEGLARSREEHASQIAGAGRVPRDPGEGLLERIDQLRIERVVHFGAMEADLANGAMIDDVESAHARPPLTSGRPETGSLGPLR
jgi:hypothetical protein